MSLHQRDAIAAAATLRACREALALRGSTIICEAIGEAAEPADWRHYPADDVYDPATHAQYFFHRHPAVFPRDGEHREYGHFHLFLRAEGMPAGVAPLVLPELAVATALPARAPPRQSAPLSRGNRDEVCHLVAIAVDAQGNPNRLMATNRWVTGETWYRAEDAIRMLDRFRFSDGTRPTLLNRWIAAVVCLFRPEIATLLQLRDQAVMERRWRWRGNVLDDPRLEIASSIEIDLDARLAAIAAEPAASAIAVPARQPNWLPPMNDGWGA